MANFKGTEFLVPFLFIGAAYFLYKKITGAGGGILNQVFGETEQKKNSEVVKDVIKKLPVDNSKISFSAATALLYAERLQKAMNPISGFSPDTDGTDEDSIFDIFSKFKTKEDCVMVYKAFGLRQYTTNWFLDNQPIDLVGWIRAELSTNDISKISQKLNWMA